MQATRLFKRNHLINRDDAKAIEDERSVTAGHRALADDVQSRARRLPEMLRHGPRDRRTRRCRRSSRRHRRTSDRRAGHPAHHAYLPHGRCRDRRRRHHAWVCRASKKSSRRACRNFRRRIARVSGVVSDIIKDGQETHHHDRSGDRFDCEDREGRQERDRIPRPSASRTILVKVGESVHEGRLPYRRLRRPRRTLLARGQGARTGIHHLRSHDASTSSRASRPHASTSRSS